MKLKKIGALSLMIFLSITGISYANASGKCDDYKKAIEQNCRPHSTSSPVGDGSIGACFGAQIGAWIARC